MSPIELLNQFFTSIKKTNNLTPRIFGCVCFVHIQNVLIEGSLSLGLQSVFIKHSSPLKGYECYHPLIKKYFVPRDVTFNEVESRLIKRITYIEIKLV